MMRERDLLAAQPPGQVAKGNGSRFNKLNELIVPFYIEKGVPNYIAIMADRAGARC